MEIDTSIFGKKGRDKVTGFEGTITCMGIYMTGCNRLGITPSVDKEGKTRETEWFDESRIAVLEQVVNPESTQGERKGGPCDSDNPPA